MVGTITFGILASMVRGLCVMVSHHECNRYLEVRFSDKHGFPFDFQQNISARKIFMNIHNFSLKLSYTAYHFTNYAALCQVVSCNTSRLVHGIDRNKFQPILILNIFDF